MVLALLFAGGVAAGAQVVPAVNGPKPLPISGTLRYDLRYSETAQLYDKSHGDVENAIASGELSYANTSESRPFSATYSGGDIWNITGESTGTGVFQHLLATQGVLGRNWSLNLSDDVDYLPQAPTTGFSGIPGVGSLPIVPTQPALPILTLNTRCLYNTLSPAYTHRLDHADSLGVSGVYGIQRFPHNDGLNVNQLEVGPQISRRLNALNSITAQYAYSRFSYPDFAITMGTQSLEFGLQRTWNRRLTTNVLIGPQWIKGSNTLEIPSSTNLTANANATYGTPLTTVTVSYYRAATGGAGVATQIGVHNDDLSAGVSRQFGKNLTLNASGAYARTRGLSASGVTYGKYGGAGATERWGRYIIVFVNYSAIQQSSSAALPTNAVSGLSHVIGFGIGYSPREMHFKK